MNLRLSEAHLNEPVIRHMRREFASIPIRQTVGEALTGLQHHPPGGRIIYFYVVDSEGRLQGVLPTRRLLLSPPERPIAEIMVADVIAIPHSATVLDACEFFTLHRLLAFPVVDDDRRVIGIVDVELYTEELGDLERSQRNDQLFQLIGVTRSEAQQTGAVAAFRSRFPWLLCNIGGGIVAAFLVGVYEAELQKAVALALFLPVVLALAESVSIQSVSLTLQLLQAQTPRGRLLLQKLRRELLTGLLLGVAGGGAVAMVALLWLRQVPVAICLLGGIVGGVLTAALLGLAMPVILRRLHREPRLAAGPIVLALTDVATLLVYFGLARWVLR
jgi:magnesium transporter